MSCQKCNSERVLQVCAKCSDLCSYRTGEGKWVSDYVPANKGLGEGGDYVEIAFCMDCGQMQGNFPLPDRKTKRKA